jgi:3-(3-hydroxy-phenyl)propionate hydroxylase
MGSVYSFRCRRIDRFRHGRVIFAGDARTRCRPSARAAPIPACRTSTTWPGSWPWCWQGDAPEALLDSYHDERAFAADDNLLNSTRSTDFITPKSASSRIYRDAVLELAKTESFARPLVNSGRLSTPTPYARSPLNTPDADGWQGRMSPGTPCADAPVHTGGRDDWLLHALGSGFVLLAFGDEARAEPVSVGRVTATPLVVGRDLLDTQGLVTQRYDGQPGSVYLIRPDQHVAARWRRFDAAAVHAALQRALALA